MHHYISPIRHARRFVAGHMFASHTFMGLAIEKLKDAVLTIVNRIKAAQPKSLLASTTALCLVLGACAKSESVAEAAPALSATTQSASVDTEIDAKVETVPDASQSPRIIQHAENQAVHKDHTHETATSLKSSEGNTKPAPKIDYIFTAAPDDHIIGRKDAPVELIVYASVTCGHCAHWFNEEWPIFKKEQIDTGHAKLVFREFPTAPPEIAIPGFLMANCAGEGAFFENVLYQFENQKNYFDRIGKGEGQEAFMEQTAKAGLNSQAEIETCFKDTSNLDRIGRSMARAEAGGITGVPGFIINGKRYAAQEISAADLGNAVETARKTAR